jgi:hypothetical protein
MLLNIFDNCRRHQISDAQLPSQEKPDFSRAHIVLDDLFDHLLGISKLSRKGKDPCFMSRVNMLVGDCGNGVYFAPQHNEKYMR